LLSILSMLSGMAEVRTVGLSGEEFEVVETAVGLAEVVVGAGVEMGWGGVAGGTGGAPLRGVYWARTVPS